MATIQEGLRDIILAGIGAVAITGEKAAELVGGLASKGAISVDQGKEIVDNRVSRENVTRFAEHQGYAVSVSEADGEFTLSIRK